MPYFRPKKLKKIKIYTLFKARMPEKKNTLWCHAYTYINNEGSTPSTREQAIQFDLY